MKLKQIIILIIVIAALAGAGVLAYRALTGTSTATPGSTTEPAASRSGAILPHGTELNFGAVKKFNSNSRLFTYPTVNREETGLPLNDIISPQ